jgi:hypothetical protein
MPHSTISDGMMIYTIVVAGAKLTIVVVGYLLGGFMIHAFRCCYERIIV